MSFCGPPLVCKRKAKQSASAFTSAKMAIQQTQGLYTTLGCPGWPVDNTCHMFGDNGSVVTSSTMPSSQLGCRHLTLSYHCVGEAVASRMVKFYHIPGEVNPMDMLSKHWDMRSHGPGQGLCCSGRETPLINSTRSHHLRREGSDIIVFIKESRE